ncbi:hypothetical protein KC19_VG015000 [Ceratodon purpureus]|uniref:Uncharacterized protein n=1 Tax=Ceratodon purpureus TaxID=3225 RepID=A0A8T0HL57_CERPU|nr:hypothetical protein KC19_VG015000 [Ceratodon purpureus]
MLGVKRLGSRGGASGWSSSQSSFFIYLFIFSYYCVCPVAAKGWLCFCYYCGAFPCRCSLAKELRNWLQLELFQSKAYALQVAWFGDSKAKQWPLEVAWFGEGESPSL